MTPELERLLRDCIIEPEDYLPQNEVGLEAMPPVGTMPDPAAAELRIQRTLEFCPDGVLAHEILVELRRAGAQLSAGAYDAVIEAYSHRGALDDALAVFQLMQRANVAPTDRTYDLLARPAARGGQYSFVERLYQAKASERGADIGADSLALLLLAYSNSLPRQAGRAEAAFRGAMAVAEERGLQSAQAASAVVLTALRRAVGDAGFATLCREYGLADPEGALTL